MRSSTKGLILIYFLLLASVQGRTQAITSPYSNYGLGELTDSSLPQHEAMGGLGVGAPEFYNINTPNPSWLIYNFLTTFQVGLKGETRRYIGGEGSVTDQTGSLRYLAMSFPIITSKWTSAVTLLPYSLVNYNIVSNDVLQATGEEVINRFEGSGGLSQLSWSHGFKVYKDFSMGVEASFIFGSIDKSIRNGITGEDASGDFTVSYIDETSYSDITLSLSFGHRMEIGDGRILNYGGVFDLPGKLEGNRNTRLSRFSDIGNVELPNSLPINDNESVSFDVPAGFAIGGSYEVVSRLLLGVDFKYQNWKNAGETETVAFQNSIGISVGGKFVPDLKNVNNYLKRVHYRFGFHYKALPYVINGTEINEFGINFGVSLPVSEVSSIDTAFKFGWRGTTENQLVRENFYQIVFGLTINDRWFVKRRFD